MTNAATLPAGGVEQIRPGRNIHLVRQPGNGDDTVFLLHGGGGNLLQWRLQWNALAAAGVDLVAWDTVGHGRSPQPRDPAAYAGAAIVADAAAILERYRRGRVLLVAHSFGARVALGLAAADPTIAGVVLVGPAPLERIGGPALFGGVLGRLPLPVLELLRPLLARGFSKRAWHPDADAALVRREQAATRGNRLFMLQAMLSDAPVVSGEMLARVHAPVAILAGAEDGIVPLASVESLRQRLPAASLRVLRRCGHQIMLEKPEDTNAAILAMLARIRGI